MTLLLPPFFLPPSEVLASDFLLRVRVLGVGDVWLAMVERVLRVDLLGAGEGEGDWYPSLPCSSSSEVGRGVSGEDDLDGPVR